MPACWGDRSSDPAQVAIIDIVQMTRTGCWPTGRRGRAAAEAQLGLQVLVQAGRPVQLHAAGAAGAAFGRQRHPGAAFAGVGRLRQVQQVGLAERGGLRARAGRQWRVGQILAVQERVVGQGALDHGGEFGVRHVQQVDGFLQPCGELLLVRLVGGLDERRHGGGGVNGRWNRLQRKQRARGGLLPDSAESPVLGDWPADDFAAHASPRPGRLGAAVPTGWATAGKWQFLR